MHNIRKAVLRFFLIIFIVFIVEKGARLCYEEWDLQTVQSKMERKTLKGTIDTIYCGTSLTYYAFCPEILDNELGTNSFNLGTASQRYMGTYYLIRDAAEENPIRQIYVTISSRMLKREQEPHQYLSGYENMRTWKWKLAYLAAVQREDVLVSSLFFTTQLEDYFDLEAVKENLENKLVAKEVSSTYAGRGWRSAKKKYTPAEGIKTKKNKSEWDGSKGESQILAEDLTYLGKIASFCRESNIHLTFVVLPSTQSYIDGGGDLDDFNEYFTEKSEEWEADYLNFVLYKERESIFTNDKFKDKYHMNVQGAETFCNILAQVMQSEHPEDYFFDNMDEF